MAADGRKRDIAIRVMVTAKEQAEIRKAANKATLPMSVYVAPRRLRRRGLKVHSVTIVPTPEFRGHIWHANPLRGIHLDYDGSDRARLRAEVGIIVCLAGPEAQRRFNPRSWRAHHGAGDHEKAADLVLNLNGPDETANAHLKWLSIVARDEIAVLWPVVEKVAHALVRKRT